MRGAYASVADRMHVTEEDRQELIPSRTQRLVQTPFQAPNCNAHAERFVRSMKEECLNRVIPLAERHFRRAMHSSSSITTANAIIRDWTTRSSTASRPQWTLAGFAVVSD